MIILIKLNIEQLLKKNQKSKYWLCNRMNVTNRNLNRMIHGHTTAISFKYIENLCRLLNCTPNDLITIIFEEEVVEN